MSKKINGQLKSYKFLIQCVKTRCEAFINYPEHLKNKEFRKGCHECASQILEQIVGMEEEINTVANSKKG